MKISGQSLRKERSDRRAAPHDSAMSHAQAGLLVYLPTSRQILLTVPLTADLRMGTGSHGSRPCRVGAYESKKEQPRCRKEHMLPVRPMGALLWTKFNVMHPYRAVQTPTHDNTSLKIETLTFDRKTTRPAKNRNREMWRKVGNISTVHGRRHFSTPSAKNERIRARLCRP